MRVALISDLHGNALALEAVLAELEHQGMLLVNPGSLGCPFRAYVAGQMPTIMPYAEYAVVESRRGDVRVELGRVALDARALAAHVAVPGFPMAGFLAREYSR